MFTHNYADISALNLGLTRRLVYAAPDALDYVNSADTQLHDVLVTAESATYEKFDLAKVWLTHSRWTSLVRQYLDPNALEAWLQMCESKLTGKKRGISFLRTEVVNGTKRGENKLIERRRWGSCLLGVGYRAMPRPQLTLHSRTTYLGFIGQLDLALAAVLAREVGERVGLDPADIKFAWHLEVAQFHSFKSMAFFFQEDSDYRNLQKAGSIKNLRAKYPTLALNVKQMNKIEELDAAGVLYGDMSFAQQVRIRRRYHTEFRGPNFGKQFEGGTRLGITKAAPLLPSITVNDLDLSALRAPTIDDTDRAGFIDEEDDE